MLPVTARRSETAPRASNRRAVSSVLADDLVDVRQHLPGQPPDPPVPTAGAFGEPRIDEGDRGARNPRRMDEVGPELGLHQEQGPGRDAAHKTPHSPGEVVGRIAVVDDVSQPLDHLHAAGRRHRRDQEAVLGEPLLECPDHRRRADGLARRDGVKPDHVAPDRVRYAPEAFAAPLRVRRLPACPHEQAQPHERRRQAEERVVDEAQNHPALILSSPPRLNGRGHPQMRTIRVDVAIAGGGIAGLWVANLLLRRGLDVALCEPGTLGGTQTLASQGLIHGGIKYALGGRADPTFDALQDMPIRWRRCLEGSGEIDLRPVPTVSDACYLWSREAFGARLAGFLASKLLRGRVTRLGRAEYPRAFSGQAGSLYRLDDFAIDVGALCRHLSECLGPRALASRVPPDGVILRGGRIAAFLDRRGHR